MLEKQYIRDAKRMEHAIGQWLAARENFHAHGRDYLDAYCAADVRLLAAFTTDWAPHDPRMFATAYQQFREALITTDLSDTEHFDAVGGCPTWRNRSR
jgi:hypothetical protein